MKDLFEDFLERKNEAPWRSKRILVAVSGGVDSMVLAHLLVQSGCQLALAHCNYQLRDGESDLDLQLMKDWAAEHAVPVFSRQFPTKQILAEQGGNLQETARRLRYDWFEELSQSEGFHYIATAHHAQDAVETLLYNLFTGTGIAGLHGILALQGKLIRPLLPYFKEDIIRFAKANAIPWREDYSNAHSNYTRNKIRNVLLPEIDRVFPGVVAQLTNNIQR